MGPRAWVNEDLSGERLPHGIAVPGHLPALDGIRGIAILAVCLFHLTLLIPGRGFDRVWAESCAFGWAGVDLFFTLSGFLITGILLDSKGAPQFFRNFYARRVLRIFPLYYAVLAVSIVVLPHLHALRGRTFGAGDGSSLWYWSYLCNLSIARRHAFPQGPLSVTWSLAIEEQFYLVWPAIVWLLTRRQLVWTCVAVCIAALLTRAALHWDGADWISLYVLTPCRMDALAAGALAAAVVRGPGGIAAALPVARQCAALVVLAAAALFTWQGTHWIFAAPGNVIGYSLLAAGFAAAIVIAVALPPRHIAARILGSRALVLFGTLSYAMYLFHDPVRSLVRETILDPGRLPSVSGSRLPGQCLFYVVALSLTTGVAWVSWNTFERRGLSLKRYFPSHSSEATRPFRPAADAFIPDSSDQLGHEELESDAAAIGL